MSPVKDDRTAVDQNSCFMCGRLAGLVCICCEDVWFCCEEHGRLHYRKEEGVCFPWKVENKEGVGRMMVTTRKVTAGETLFIEEPIVHGPNQEGFPVCLSCCELVTLEYLCPSCGYPMCNEECARDSAHQEECSVLSRGDKPVFENEVTDAYHCILPLRMVMLAQTDPNRFNLADHLMDHEEERKSSKDWLTTEKTVVHNLMQNCEGEAVNNLTVADIRRAVGVLEVNSYEVSDGLRGCFPIGSLLSHSCVPNSCHIWTLEPPYTNTCIASVDLEPGQEVLTTYQIPTTSTLRRRSNLKAGWYFDCSCERCSSLSELGTNMNTLVCPKCKKPNLMPENPLQFGSVWKCSCGHEETETVVKTIVDNIIKDTKDVIEKQRNNVNSWLELENSSLKLVHPQHEAMVEITKWLIPVLCRGPNQVTSEFPTSLVQRKLVLAKSYLSVLDVVEPGFTKSRVKVLYEIIETELFLMFQKNPGVDLIKKNLASHRLQLRLVINVLERLGPNKGFETVLVKASENLIKRLEDILSQIDENCLKLEDWREGWSLIELLRG